MKLSDIGYMTASKFTRLNAAEIKKLKPITILIHKNEPVRVVVLYEHYLKLQREIGL